MHALKSQKKERLAKPQKRDSVKTVKSGSVFPSTFSLMKVVPHRTTGWINICA